ncbi:MAG: hypothetical protein FWD03_00960 [Defluviitaleaceae bacterium]|nr:hypothetical protein [Defluviitaleaceae bacterium]
MKLIKGLIYIAATIIFIITFTACWLASPGLPEPDLLIYHPSVLGDETSLSISTRLEGLVTMIVVAQSAFFVDVVIYNDSEWLLTTTSDYMVEIYSNDMWLPIQWPEYFGFAGMGPVIEPRSAVEMQKRLPNLIPFPPPDSLSLEPGRYRLRTEIGMHDSSLVHDVVAEFYVAKE